MIAHSQLGAKTQESFAAVEDLHNFVRQAAVEGKAAHEVEEGVFRRLLRIGRGTMEIFFDAQGDGDMGETVQLPEGKVVRRLKEKRKRPYVTIFGAFELERVVYAVAERQKLELVPLDARLGLPESKFSYLLQDWDQMIATEQPYKQVSAALGRMLELEQHVDSLERMSRQMAPDAEAFAWSHEAPPEEEEGEILVQTSDCKGVPIRRPAEAPPIYEHRHKSGPKPNRKKMATVGSIYTVDRFVRTPEEVVEALFHDGQEKPSRRPRPQHKWTYARLDEQTPDGDWIEGRPAVFGWIDQHARQRNPAGAKESVWIMDAQESLWDAVEVFQEDCERVEILDLLHVTPRLWDVAHLFHPPDSRQAESFVRERTLRILRGEVLSVVRGLRQMATLRGLRASGREKLETVCAFFEKNQHRMRYDEYLSRGYPIASGVIEGACRHVVKDRLERTGMTWTVPGAQAMLQLRCVSVSGQWDAFIQYRIAEEQRRLHPHRDLVTQATWPIAA